MGIYRNIKGIIFDLDGTLFHLAVDWQIVRDRLQPIVGREVASISKLLKSSPTNLRAKIYTVIDEAEVEGANNGHALDGVIEGLRELSSRYKFAVVTNNGRSSARIALEKLGIPSSCLLVAREDVSSLKPSPEGFKLALSLLHMSPTEVIAVGDSKHDVEAAQVCGLQCIVVKNELLSFAPQGERYLENFQDLTQLLGGINE